jgi:hypothetical protein
MYVYLKSKLPTHIYCHSVSLAQLRVNDVQFFFAYLFPRVSPEIQVPLACIHTHAATLLTVRGKNGRVSCNGVSSHRPPLSILPSPLNITDHRSTIRLTTLLLLYFTISINRAYNNIVRRAHIANYTRYSRVKLKRCQFH